MVAVRRAPGGGRLRFRARPAFGRFGAILTLMAGLVAAVNGGLVLALANGGPGTGGGYQRNSPQQRTGHSKSSSHQPIIG